MEVLQAIFVDPFLNLLIGLQNIIPGHDLGLAIIALTLIVRLILYPASAKQIRTQRAMQELQPRINEIREEHKDDKEAQSKALMEFYRENKISPLSSCGPMVLQLALIYPLFLVFRLIVTGGDFIDRLYPFIAAPALPLDMTFFGILDLAASQNITLALLTAGAQFLQSWMLMRKRKKEQPEGKPKEKDKSPASAISRNLLYVFPIITGYIAYTFPAGIALYWLASTVFAIIQQLIIMRTISSQPKPPHEHAGEVVVK